MNRRSFDLPVTSGGSCRVEAAGRVSGAEDHGLFDGLVSFGVGLVRSGVGVLEVHELAVPAGDRGEFLVETSFQGCHCGLNIRHDFAPFRAKPQPVSSEIPALF